MNSVIEDYRKLLQSYLNGELPAMDFILKFLDKWQQDNTPMEGELYDIMDQLWGDVEAFQPDEEMYRDLEKQSTGLYLNTAQFRGRAEAALRDLQRLASQEEKRRDSG